MNHRCQLWCPAGRAVDNDRCPCQRNGRHGPHRRLGLHARARLQTRSARNCRRRHRGRRNPRACRRRPRRRSPTAGGWRAGQNDAVVPLTTPPIRPVGSGVGDGVQRDGVVTVVAIRQVAGLDEERVITGTAREHAGRVATGPAARCDQRVVALAAVAVVDAHARIDQVVAALTEQRVVARITVQRIAVLPPVIVSLPTSPFTVVSGWSGA